MKKKFKIWLFLSTNFLVSLASASSFTWTTPWTPGIGTGVYTRTGTFVVGSSTATYTCDYTFSGAISVSNVWLTINGTNLTPFSPNTGATGTFGLTNYNGTPNTITMSAELTSSGFCDVGNINFDFQNLLGQSVYSPNTAITTAKIDLNFTINASKTVTTAYAGCSNYLNIKTDLNRCNPSYKLIIVELDPTNNFSYITGTSVEKALTSTEVSNMQSSGLILTSLTGTGGTINLIADKYFSVDLVDVTSGGWIDHFRRIHIKAGTWDRYMEDGPYNPPVTFSGTDLINYYAFEPFEQYDDDIFRSRALWNKLSNTANQNSNSHEYPDYITNPLNSNKLFIKTMTHGCANPSTTANLRLFWTRARTDEVFPNDWLYDMTNNALPSVISPFAPVPLGAEITVNSTYSAPYLTSNSTNTVPYVLPSGTASHQIPWSSGVLWWPPNPVHYGPSNGSMNGATNRPIICLLARISETSTPLDPIVFEPSGNTVIKPYVKNNNNVVTRNTLLYDDPAFLVYNGNGHWNHGFGNVMVTNSKPTTRVVSLCVDLMPVAGSTETFTDYGAIQIGVTNGLWSLWSAGGSSSTNISTVSTTLLQMTNGTHACLDNITLPANYNASELIGLRFVYDSLSLPTDSNRNFSYQLSMIDGEGNTGSNSIFEVGVNVDLPAGLTSVMSPTSIKDETVNSQMIVYPNPATNTVILNTFDLNIDNSSLVIYDNTGRLIKTIKCNSNNNYFTYQMDVSDWKTGVYTIKYMTDSKIVTQKVTVIH